MKISIDVTWWRVFPVAQSNSLTVGDVKFTLDNEFEIQAMLRYEKPNHIVGSCEMLTVTAPTLEAGCQRLREEAVKFLEEVS